MINILIASISGIVTFSLKGKPRGERSTYASDKTKKRLSVHTEREDERVQQGNESGSKVEIGKVGRSREGR